MQVVEPSCKSLKIRRTQFEAKSARIFLRTRFPSGKWRLSLADPLPAPQRVSWTTISLDFYCFLPQAGKIVLICMYIFVQLPVGHCAAITCKRVLRNPSRRDVRRNFPSPDYSVGCGAVKSLQHGFSTGLNSINSTRVKSGS